MNRSHAAGLVFAAASLAIAAATLLPVHTIGSPPDTYLKLTPVLSDLIRNVLLFVPLGVGLALRRWRTSRSLCLAFAVSIAIEMAQLAIPGRYTSPWDPFGNTAGAALGLAGVRSASHWLFPSFEMASRLSLAAAAVCAAAFGFTGVLIAPSLPATRYYAHWTPSFDHLHRYHGQVVRASLGTRALPHGRLDSSASIRDALAGEFELRVSAVAGAPPGGPSALFMITDEREREILLLGPDRLDLVFRLRGRATAAGLETWGLRLHGALHNLGPGDPLEIRVRHEGSRFCAEVNTKPHCHLGFTIGDGWTLFVPPARLAPPLRTMVSAAWVAALLLPLGYWYRRGWTSHLALAVAGAAILCPPLVTPLLPTPLTQVVGGLTGFALGLGGRLKSRPTRAQASSARR